MILVLDNYDSFTYNLVQALGSLDSNITVVRNDEITNLEIRNMNPNRIVISPGPGRPENAGLSVEVIRVFGSQIPILGVCLGHQAITVAFEGKVIPAPEILHGKTSHIIHNGTSLFKNVESPLIATRYHSLMIERESLPSCLKIIAETETGMIMAVKHKEWPVYGVQFHPESIATKTGTMILENFLSIETEYLSKNHKEFLS